MKRLTISERYYLKEEREILAYISRHRPVSVFDIELCCHMEKKPVLGHLVNLRRQGKVTCLRGKWQIARTAKRDQQLRVVYQHTQESPPEAEIPICQAKRLHEKVC